MCGRFTLTIPLDVILERFMASKLPGLEFEPSYNIAPSQNCLVISRDKNSERDIASTKQWGLIPAWAKERKGNYMMINARSETIDQKPTFRHLIRGNRCLVIADGFYEWKKEGSRKKLPNRITLKKDQPFAMAGLWDKWSDGKEELSTFTIITTQSNTLIEPIHDRMPVIIRPEHEKDWLSTDLDWSTAQKLLTPYPSDEMKLYPVSSLVNSPKNNEPACIHPLGEQ